MTARLEIELRELNVFMIVTDSGSMTGAAARLGMTQSAVSQVITKLEGHLGAKLLDRSVRPISVTNAGHTFYERAVSILEQAKAATQSVRDVSHARIPELRVAMIDSFATTFGSKLVENLRGLADRWTIREGIAETVKQSFLRRDVDIAITTKRLKSESRLERYEIMYEPYMFALPACYKGHAESLQELSDRLSMIHYGDESDTDRQIRGFLQRRRLSVPVKLQFDSIASVLGAVASGIGWAFATPLFVMQATAYANQLSLRPIPGATLGRRLTLVARQHEFGDVPCHMSQEVVDILRIELIPRMSEMAPWAANEILLGDMDDVIPDIGSPRIHMPH